MSKEKQEKETTEDEKVTEEKERRANARFCAILLSVVVVILLFFNFWSSNFTFVLVQGESMDTTLKSGEYLLSYKVVSPKHELERGDIIVVDVRNIPEWKKENAKKPAKARTQFIIKRLIALEGDIVRCTDGEMEICYAGTWDERTLNENYDQLPFVKIKEPYAYYDESRGGKTAICNTYEYIVGKGEIFFLGDNRNNSSDSRYGIKDEEGNIWSYSTLDNRLYKASDVKSIVPDWALNHKKGLKKYLMDGPANIKNFFTKPFR